MRMEILRLKVNLHYTVNGNRKFRMVGGCSFAIASLAAWNRLPHSVRSQHTETGFRRQLETHLFRLT